MKKLTSLLLIVTLTLAIISCGKVTQIAKDEDENPSFDLTYALQVYPTTNATIKALEKTPHQQDLTVEDSPVYVQVLGVEASGKKSELSWGKALLLQDKKAIQAQDLKEGEPKKIIYKSSAFRKDGITLLQSDYTWSKLSYKNETQSWTGESKKVDRSFPLYFVRVYTNTGKYFFKTLDEVIVSKNKTVNVGQFTDYDTVISRLLMAHLRKSKGGLDDAVTLQQLTELYPVDLIEGLESKKSKNLIKKFNVKSPLFKFDQDLEKLLLTIIDLSLAKEFEEAISLVDKSDPKSLSKSAKTLLKAQLKQLESSSTSVAL